MSAITYDSIGANIEQVSVDGPVVKVIWKCPVSRRDAIVLAFDAVKSSFEWNDSRRQFVATTSASTPTAHV
jgi:hypothetical protein